MRINRETLKKKLDHGENIKLVTVIANQRYQNGRIPGSICFESPADALAALGKDEEIVLYDTQPPWVGSVDVYWELLDRGYRKVHYYAGGLSEWQAAGYPIN